MACLHRLQVSHDVELRCIIELPQVSGDARGQRRWADFLRKQGAGPVAAPCSAASALSAYPAAMHLRVLDGDESILTTAATVKSLQLDFLLLFSARAYRPQLGNLASSGVWCLFLTDPQSFQSEVVGFWELYYDHDVSAAALVQLCDQTTGYLLRSGYFAIDRTRYGPDVRAKLSSAIEWPVSACRDLQGSQKAWSGDPVTRLSTTAYGFPSSMQLAWFRVHLVRNALAKFLRNQLYRISWNIGALGSRLSTLLNQDCSVDPAPLMNPSRDEYFADPCAIEEHNCTFIFFERFSHRNSRGAIAMIEQHGEKVSAPVSVIIEPFHLSYPQIIKHGNDVYCVPESTSERSVFLYKAVRFPDRWERVHTILQDFAAVDSTLVWWSGNWWLFCTNSDEGYNSHLHIWYSPELFGPWKPHVKNPVKIDARSSGPAGPLILHDDILYRPAQDCSRSYGRRIVMNKVEILTPNDFKESVVGTISPSRASAYHDGLHTISAAGANVIVDMMRYEFQPQGLIGLFTGTAGYFARRLGASEDTIAKLKGKPSRR